MEYANRNLRGGAERQAREVRVSLTGEHCGNWE